MSKKLLIAILSGGMALQSRAETMGLSDMIGLAKTFYNGVIGWTTVTPGFALGYWRLINHGTYQTTNYNYSWQVTRNMTTGAYFYNYTYNESPGPSGGSTEPFNIESTPARRNYRCDTSANGLTYIDEIFENFYTHVWPASVSHSGYFSPQAPYPVWLKSYYCTLKPSCAAITPVCSPITNGTQIYDSGTTSITFSIVNAEYSWPPICWVGGAYDN